jgi:hypothetical protein
VPGGPLAQSVFTQQFAIGMQLVPQERWVASQRYEHEVMLLQTPVVPGGPLLQSEFMQQFPVAMQVVPHSLCVASHW